MDYYGEYLRSPTSKARLPSCPDVVIRVKSLVAGRSLSWWCADFGFLNEESFCIFFVRNTSRKIFQRNIIFHILPTMLCTILLYLLYLSCILHALNAFLTGCFHNGKVLAVELSIMVLPSFFIQIWNGMMIFRWRKVRNFGLTQCRRLTVLVTVCRHFA